MRWISRQTKEGEWYKRFAWVPRLIRDENGKRLWVWLEPYEERVAKQLYLTDHIRLDLERRLSDGSNGKIVKIYD